MQLFSGRGQSYILPIIGITLVIFVAQLMIPSITNFLIIDSTKIPEIWRLVTHIFAHGGFNHIFFNMYGVFLFGLLLEPIIGSKRFLTVYLGTGIFAGLVSILAYPLLLGQPFFGLGASGALMGIIGTLIMLRPKTQLLFFFVIPIPLWVAGIAWAALDLIGFIGPANGVANLAHLVGLVSGLAIGYYLKENSKTIKKKFSNSIELNEDDVQEYIRSGGI